MVRVNNGWIRLWRSSTENPLYFAEPFTKWQAWTDLLLLANHQRCSVCVRGILVSIDRGQVLAGEEFLAKRWKWSRGKVRRFIAHLESKTVQQIVQHKDNVCGVITICKYDIYQGGETDTNSIGGTTNGTASSTTDGQQTVQQTDILKNEKKEKNENNKEYASFLEKLNAALGTKFRSQSKKLASALTARLAEGHSIEDIISAAVACSQTPYHKENRQYLTPEFILRPDKLEQYLKLVCQSGETQTVSRPPRPAATPAEMFRDFDGGCPRTSFADRHGVRYADFADTIRRDLADLAAADFGRKYMVTATDARDIIAARG